MLPLPDAFLRLPLAHRGLHDRAAGLVENSLAAAAAAIAAGYGIECDLQLSADGEAMVFHDETLERLTPESGPVSGRSAAELGRIPLRAAADGDTIPTFAALLALVRGRVPLLVELKDQTGSLGPGDSALAARAAACLEGYAGPVALMSFNPHAVAAAAEAAPETPRGLTTCRFRPEDWPGVPAARLAALDAIPDFDRTGSSFVSHHFRSLDMAPVRALRARGLPVLSWTIRSPAEEDEARKGADNITFEGYRPAR